jgi:hypothetical protein
MNLPPVARAFVQEERHMVPGHEAASANHFSLLHAFSNSSATRLALTWLIERSQRRSDKA